MFPCNECAKLIIQAGITTVVFYEVSPKAAKSMRYLWIVTEKKDILLLKEIPKFLRSAIFIVDVDCEVLTEYCCFAGQAQGLFSSQRRVRFTRGKIPSCISNFQDPKTA